jgi:cytochrome P450
MMLPFARRRSNMDGSWPPGPPTSWLRGNLAAFRGDRLGFLTDCARYGDVVYVRFGPRRVFLLNHPDLIEQVLVGHGRDFIKHFALRLNPLVFGKGLLTSEGDFWLRQRRLIQPAFSRQRLAAYATPMVAAAQHMGASWKAGETRDIFAEMMRLTLAIAARTLFGADVEGDAREIGNALRMLQEDFDARTNRLLTLPVWVPTPYNLRHRRVVRKLDQVIYRFIRQRRAEKGETNDLLSLLLHARDEDDGTRMTDKQVRDEAMTLFLASHETTALALSWTWYLLARHPHIAEELRAEVERVIGDRPPTADDVPELTFAEKVVLESMRLLPPVYIMGREVTQDCTLGGYRMRRGMTVLMSQWVVQHDPRFYAAPETFRPQRWSADFMRTLPKFAYFPFGGGPRLCIGNTFAMMEMTLILAVLAQRFHFTLVPGHEVVPWPTFTLRPRDGIMATIAARHPERSPLAAFDKASA